MIKDNIKISEIYMDGTNTQRYDLFDLIGMGTFGTVYRAFDKERDEDVALKIACQSSRNDRIFNLFSREMDFVKNISHENIIQVYELHKGTAKYPVLSMELAESSLSDLIDLNEVTLELTLNYLGRIAGALDYIHTFEREKNGNKVVHRDVKPSNILLFDNRKTVKLADFGCVGRKGTASQHGVGTPPYIPPEAYQENGMHFFPFSDQYSLALVASECIFKDHPFMEFDEMDSTSLSEKSGNVKERCRVAGITDNLLPVFLKALNPDFNKRYNSCTEFVKDLRNNFAQKIKIVEKENGELIDKVRELEEILTHPQDSMFNTSRLEDIDRMYTLSETIENYVAKNPELEKVCGDVMKKLHKRKLSDYKTVKKLAGEKYIQKAGKDVYEFHKFLHCWGKDPTLEDDFAERYSLKQIQDGELIDHLCADRGFTKAQLKGPLRSR